jgi:methionyl-tRNA formyltransferase
MFINLSFLVHRLSSVVIMDLVYLGSGEFGVECLNALSGSRHALRFIVTQPANPAGRGRKPNPTPVASWADAHSVPFTETDNVNAPDVIEAIAGYQPDLIVVIAFGQKIGNDLVNLPPKGAINVHASLLPKYRGAAPINWAIINGETETGISIITLAEKMDAGLVLAQAQTRIGPDETADQLHERLGKLAAPLLLKTIDQIADGTAVYAEQDHSKATFAPKLKKTDGFIDFAEPADVLARKIRGLWPWPGASADYLSKKTGKSIRVTIAGGQVVKTANRAALAAGTFDENLNVICGQDALKLTQIKPAGSALMDFKAFTNGRQTHPGDSLTRIEYG